MQIFLDSFGASLRVKDGMLWVKLRHSEGRRFALREVSVIYATRGVSLTSDALLLALEHEIPVILLDNIGHSKGLVWSGKFGSTAAIRRAQVFFGEKDEGMLWVADTLRRKAENQRHHLECLEPLFDAADARRLWGRSRSILNGIIKKYEAWSPETSDFSKEKTPDVFRGWEGTATRQYWRALAVLLPKDWGFEGRGKRPATDRFNCLLNYLYGILYATVELALLRVGLDPAFGVLHSDRQHNRPTLVYDFIELFRHWCERVALTLVLKNDLPDDLFLEKEDGSFWLQGSGKGRVVEAMIKHLDGAVLHKGKKVKRLTYLHQEAQALATQIRNH